MANEIFAPDTSTFGAGNDVVGFGTTLPTELAAYRPYGGTYAIKSALVFYSSDWNPSATVGQVKFWFIAMAQVPGGGTSQLFTGCGYVANASVSQTAVIRIIDSQNVTNTGTQFHNVHNRNGGTMWQVFEDNSAGSAEALLFDSSGHSTVALVSNFSRDGLSGGYVQTSTSAGDVVSKI